MSAASGKAAGSGRDANLAAQGRDGAIEGCTILTASGLYVNPMRLTPADVCIEDVAHALGNQCRYSGHTREFYSVAEHSVRVAYILEEAGEPWDVVLWGLLHDGAEAYLVDLPRPLKRDSALGDIYLPAEERCLRAVMTHFGLWPSEPPAVRAADLTMLATERRDLMPGVDVWAVIADTVPLLDEIEPWDPPAARETFLFEFGRIRDLGGRRAA